MPLMHLNEHTEHKSDMHESVTLLYVLMRHNVQMFDPTQAE